MSVEEMFRLIDAEIKLIYDDHDRRTTKTIR